MKYILSIMALVCIIAIAGCSFTSAVTPVVQKMYGATCKVENYINSADTTNLVASLQKADVTLKVVSKALAFVATKVTDEKVKANIELAVASINQISDAIAKIDVSKIDDTKKLILVNVTKVKIAIEEVARFLDIPLGLVKIETVGITISTTDLDKVTDDLTTELNKAMGAKTSSVTPVGSK